MGGPLRLDAQDKTGFPEGFDAVQAAPQSHKVLFENAFVRELQVHVARIRQRIGWSSSSLRSGCFWLRRPPSPSNPDFGTFCVGGR
jgi:hypothetical protein